VRFKIIFVSDLLILLSVKKQVTICSSAIEACELAEAVVIATKWKEFKGIDWGKMYAGMNKPAFVFDGHLLLDSEKLTKIGFKFVRLLLFSFLIGKRFAAGVVQTCAKYHGEL
jgi:UDP-N-acetyl-D-mannosaminuronate dehydrogenase